MDDDLGFELVVDNLRQRGHEVNRLCSMDDALRDLTSLAGSDLVVLDLIMPHSSDALMDCLDGARCTRMAVFRELRSFARTYRG